MTSWLTSDLVLLGSDAPLPLDAPFTLAIAERLGVRRPLLRTLVDRGLVRREGQGVYAAAQAPTSPEFRAAALALVISPGAVVTDRTAAWLHGIDLQKRSTESLMPPVSAFQAPGTRSRRPEVASGERMLAPYDVMEVGGIRVTTPLRTACDLGRLLWRFDALAALDAFLRVGLDHDELLAATTRFKGYRGVIQLRAFAPPADPRAESVAESWLRGFWIEADLPKPEPQWWVHDDLGVPIFRLDLSLPEILFAAEYDGEQFHTQDADRQRDEGRREWLASQRSWHLLPFTKDDIFAPRAEPGPRLREGLVTARRRLALPTSYPTLSPTRHAGSTPLHQPGVTGQRHVARQK